MENGKATRLFDKNVRGGGGLIGLMETKQTDVIESVISAVGLGWPNDGHQLPGPYHGDFGQHQTSKTIISGSTLPHAMWQLTEDVLLTQIDVGWETSIANHQKTHCRMLGGRKKPAKILSLRIGLVEKNRTPNSFFCDSKNVVNGLCRPGLNNFKVAISMATRTNLIANLLWRGLHAIRWLFWLQRILLPESSI